MKDLIERLEKATGPDRRLDVAIYVAEFPHACVEMDKSAQDKFDAERAPSYTSSIDAALTLVPKNFDYEVQILGTADEDTWTCASIRWWQERRSVNEKGWRHRSGNSKHTAIALCIAALKAREAMAPRHSPAETSDPA